MKLKHVYAESLDSTLDLLVFPDIDLDATFMARCLLTGELLQINGWLFVFEDKGEGNEVKVKITSRSDWQSYTISHPNEAKDKTDRSAAATCFLTGQAVSMGDTIAEIIYPDETYVPSNIKQAIDETEKKIAACIDRFCDDGLAEKIAELVGNLLTVVQLQNSENRSYVYDMSDAMRTTSGFIKHIERTYFSR